MQWEVMFCCLVFAGKRIGVCFCKSQIWPISWIAMTGWACKKASDVLYKPGQPTETDPWVLVSFCLLKQRPHAGISAPFICCTNCLMST